MRAFSCLFDGACPSASLYFSARLPLQGGVSRADVGQASVREGSELGGSLVRGGEMQDRLRIRHDRRGKKIFVLPTRILCRERRLGVSTRTLRGVNYRAASIDGFRYGTAARNILLHLKTVCSCPHFLLLNPSIITCVSRLLPLRYRGLVLITGSEDFSRATGRKNNSPSARMVCTVSQTKACAAVQLQWGGCPIARKPAFASQIAIFRFRYQDTPRVLHENLRT